MDIAPDLLEKIQESFRNGYTHNKKIASIVSKVGAGKGTGTDSANFATEVGAELKRAVSETITPDVLPDERMYYNIAEKVFPPLLKKNHELINAVSKEVAKTTAQKAGLNLNGLDVPTDKNKIEGIVKHASKGEKYKSVKKSTENSLVNYSQGVNDESVKRNAEFLGNSGVKAYIIRTTTGKCCQWCTNIAGKYEYGQEPKDIYRRHANCDCVVEYVTDGKRQNVHSKQWKDSEAVEERKSIEPLKPSAEDKEKLKSLGVENGGKIGKVKSLKNNNLKYSVEREDITQRYINNSKPKISFKYSKPKTSTEVVVAQKLFDMFGGELEVLNEVNPEGIPNPDYLWNGELWELKNPKSEKGINSALKKGLKQIQNNPGGVVLDIGKEINFEEATENIEKRLQWMNKGNSVKIIMMEKGDFYGAYKYTKK